MGGDDVGMGCVAYTSDDEIQSSGASTCTILFFRFQVDNIRYLAASHQNQVEHEEEEISNHVDNFKVCYLVQIFSL